MVATQAKTRRTALMTVSLEAASVFVFGTVLAAGNGGNWAFPTFLAVIALIAIVGFALMVRAQRAQSRDR